LGATSFSPMSWALVDRSTIHARVLQERRERELHCTALIKKKLDKALADAKTRQKAEGRVVLGASLVCQEPDCAFGADLSRCRVCATPQSWSYMRQWYAFHAKRLTHHFRPMKIEFQSCSFPGFGPKGRAVKGRDTKGLFLVRLANDTDDDDEMDEESLLPPLHKDKLHKDRLHKDRLHKDKTCGGEPGSSSHTKVCCIL